MHIALIESDRLYKKDTNLTHKDVEILREWLKKQPHLPQLEETQLLIFLHSCYYKIEATKTTIDHYFTRRTLYPELFQCPSEEKIRRGCGVGLKAILPNKTPDGFSIFFSKLLDFKAENFNFYTDLAIANMTMALELHKNGFSDGIVAMYDCKGLSLSHLTKMNFTSLKHNFDHVQEGQPIRIKQIHIINSVPFMDKIMSILKMLLANEIFNMIQIHSSLDDLYKFIPKDCLPEDYGGNLPSCQKLQEETLKNLLDNLDFFKWHELQTVDESKRLEKSKSEGSRFGLDGTFKKLEID